MQEVSSVFSSNFAPMDYVTRSFENIDWVTLLLLGCLLCYAIAKYIYPKRFQEFMLLPVTNKYFLVLGKNTEIKHPFNVLLFLPQIVMFSLFIFLFVDAQETPIEKPLILFVQICAFYTMFVLAKFTIEKLVGTIFNLEILIDKYLHQKLSYRNLLAILIFIGNLIFFYIYKPSTLVLLISLGIIAILNTIALYATYKTNRQLIFSQLFYFILYLCALEISPYIILYKAFV